MKKFILFTLTGFLLLLLILISYIQLASNPTFDAPYPNIEAVSDPDVIERGKYLVYGPAHCATCHVPVDRIADVERGEIVPMIGGWKEDIPPVKMRAPNITPDPETGIGNLTDAEIARALRYGVGHDGRYLLPVMPFHDMSDEDLTAIISYLRAQEPIRHEPEPLRYTFLGKALLAFGILKPVPPEEVNPPQTVEKAATPEYGRYLSTAIANCQGCHTKLDPMTAQYVDTAYSGGFLFEPGELTQGFAFMSPNITPDPETGIMYGWTEEQFIARFKGGRVFEGSPMPWGPFSRMDSTDLAAIYQYLQTIEPAHRDRGQIVFSPGEKLP